MRKFLAAAAAVLSTGLAPAMAQDWSGQITPYVWGAGLGGDVTPFAGAPTLSFDKSLSEVLEDTDGAFFLSGFARRDRLVLMGDLSWSTSSKAGTLPPGLPAEGKVTQRSLTLLAGWRAVSNDRMTLDALAGARAWRVKGRIRSRAARARPRPARISSIPSSRCGPMSRWRRSGRRSSMPMSAASARGPSIPASSWPR
ncbi:hypothetical protein [Paracoccus mutanolyticus]|uniref:hypothetical protein n=1 Tax=Paracoccus mutanolyticus TaxID=1499308 RepID=UPI001CB9AA35|nr:hypothetical protein [Paracoccus mutanolyticus]